MLIKTKGYPFQTAVFHPRQNGGQFEQPFQDILLLPAGFGDSQISNISSAVVGVTSFKLLLFNPHKI